MRLTKGKFKGLEFSATPQWYQTWLQTQPFFSSMFEGSASRPQTNNALKGWDGYSRKGQAAYDAVFEREKADADEYDPDPATRDKRDAEDIIIGLCAKAGVKLTRKDLTDWGITGFETVQTLTSYANDLISEDHTERCAAKNAWRYQV